MMHITIDGMEAVVKTMSPDYQISKMEDGEKFTAATIYQAEETNKDGNPITVTTFISPDGIAYQTCSAFVAKLVDAIDKAGRKCEDWIENPIEFTVKWVKTNSGKKMLQLTV